MEDRFKSGKEKKSSNKKQKQKHPNNDQQHQTTSTTTTTTTTATTSNISFKPSSDVKGLKFGGQFIVKSFTVRRASPCELSLLLNHNDNDGNNISKSSPPFPSTISFIPTNFTILAHHAWHTLTLGLGTKKSKVIIFVFDTVSHKSSIDLSWPPEIPLGEVNKKMIRGLTNSEIARFKFRKGCVTFYVFGVRRKGERGFQCGDDLRHVLHSVVELQDFLDHTAMLALPNQRSLNYSNSSSHYSHPVSAH